MDESPNQSNASGAEATSPSNVRAVSVEVARLLAGIGSPNRYCEDPSPPKCVCPKPQSQKEDSYKCPVCLDSVRRREPVSTKCGHVFCKDCLIAAISSVHKCPMCNKKLTQSQFSRIYL